MVKCRITLKSPAGVTSYVGLFRSTTRAAIEAIKQHGDLAGASVRVESI